MWTDQWCIDGLPGYPAPSWGWHASDVEPAEVPPGDDGGWFADGWSLGAAAIMGVAAYEGVRRLLGRGRPAPAARAQVPTTDGEVQASEPLADTSPAPDDAELVGELMALHDLAPTDAMRRRVVRVLARAGVEPVSATGTRFDDQRHDVMGTTDATSDAPPGTVVEVLRPGFIDERGRILRPAQVVVASDRDGAW